MSSNCRFLLQFTSFLKLKRVVNQSNWKCREEEEDEGLKTQQILHMKKYLKPHYAQIAIHKVFK